MSLGKPLRLTVGASALSVKRTVAKMNHRAMVVAAMVAVMATAFVMALVLIKAPSTLPMAALTSQVDLEARRAQASAVPEARELARPLAADFASVAPSADVRRLADWVAVTQDNGGTSFVIIDKRAALLYVLDGQARLVGTSPVLLGAALGDHSVPGIGERPIELIRPAERTTPSGRFVAERGRNARGEDVVWVDYEAAVSMHRVLTTNPAERRLERLGSATAADNRISYGCINLPATFYEMHIRPAFARHSGIVYILPDKATMQQVFGL